MSAKPKEETSKCLICDKKSTGRVSVDLDIKGIPFCKKHDFDVQMYVFMLVGRKPDDAESWLSFAQKAAKAKKVLVRKPLGEADPSKARSKNAPPKKGKRG